MENSTTIIESNIDSTSPSDKKTIPTKKEDCKNDKKTDQNINAHITDHIETQTIDNKDNDTKKNKKMKLESEKTEPKKKSSKSKKIKKSNEKPIISDLKWLMKNQPKKIKKKDPKKKSLIKNRGRWKKHIPSFMEIIKLLPSNNVFLNIPNELKEFQKHLPVSKVYGYRLWGKTYPKYVEPFLKTVIYSFDKKTFYFSGDSVYQFKTEVLNLFIHKKRVFFILEDCFYKYERRQFIKFNEKVQDLCVNANNELVLIKGKQIYSKSLKKTLKMKSNIKKIFPTTEINKYYLLLENNHLIYFDMEIHYLFKIYSEIYKIQCIKNDLILLTEDGLYIYYGDQKKGTFLRKKYFIKSFNNTLLLTASNDFIFINNVSTNNLIIFLKSDLTKYISLFFHPTILNISISGNVIYTLFYDSVKRTRFDRLHLLKNPEDLEEYNFFSGLFDPLRSELGQKPFMEPPVDIKSTSLLERSKLKPYMMRMFAPLTKYLEELEVVETQKRKDTFLRPLFLENINTKFHKYFKEEVKPIEIRQFLDVTAEQKEIKDEVEKKVIKRKRGF